ncbi:hypothetical protein P4O66_002599 [Electrophorus voltai]|uniref:Uncharacterized protein n=1 Tax=Electrophorus voltai TaxID=2609070 RepID=A0AAD8YY85_9TELE|nr:hypothetical protein P4O66_002599 [Electrophorus voltai]
MIQPIMTRFSTAHTGMLAQINNKSAGPGEHGPGAEEGESYVTTIPQRDLPSYWPRSRNPQEGRNPLNDFGGALYMVWCQTLLSYRDQPDYENRHSDVDSAGSYDP